MNFATQSLYGPSIYFAVFLMALFAETALIVTPPSAIRMQDSTFHKEIRKAKREGERGKEDISFLRLPTRG
jgi:hypothetical protein